MAGNLSSVNLIAAAGILGNVGGIPIAANSAVISSVSSYNTLNVVTQFANVKLTGNAVLSTSTITSLSNLASNTFPAVTNAIPIDYIGELGNTPLTGLSGLTSTEINNIMGNGDLGKFEQLMALADSFVITTNMLINSAINANNNSAVATYTSQDSIMTGGLSQVSEAFSVFGNDLVALGYAINLADLPNIGSPQALLKEIYFRTNGSSELNTALLNAGIDQNVLTNLDTVTMTDEQQKIAFDVMTKITGSALSQVLRLLKVNTKGLTNLAELLNPVKAFPNSFNTLTAPTINGLRGIYINSSGAVNTNLEIELPSNVLFPLQGYKTSQNTYSQLRNIIPPDWALANKALQVGLQQVTSIFESTLSLLGAATEELETNKGLNLINELTSPLPASTTNFFINTYAAGTGTNGTFLLADLIGSAAGWNITDNMTNTTLVLSTLDSQGQLTTLTNGTDGVFTVMQNAIDGVYGIPDGMGNVLTIPPGLPGAGTYSTYDLTFTGPGTPGNGLIPVAYSLIGNIVANNSSNVTIANSAWSNIAAQLVLEQNSQSIADIVYANLTPGSMSAAFATNISSYGTETAVGGAAWFLESVANTSTLGGQAIISSMREARNQVRLQQAGIGTDIQVDDTGVEPQTSLSSGQYTASEAAAQKII